MGRKGLVASYTTLKSNSDEALASSAGMQLTEVCSPLFLMVIVLWGPAMESLRGKFLIASPHLPDPNFARTVVLMVEHHEEGALGLVVNRSSHIRLESFWQQIDTQPCPSEEFLSLGGPVEGQVMCLHVDPTCSEGQVIPGVHLATQPDLIRTVVQQAVGPFRVYWGYAGWGAGQLESELAVGGWLSIPATDDLVFRDDTDALWKLVVSRSGQQILREALSIGHFPENAELN